MTNGIFGFLDEASSNKILQKIREETKPRAGDELEQVELDPDSDATSDYFQTIRRQSKTLIDLLQKYEPALECESSDTACLYLYILHTVPQFDFGNKREGLDRLKRELLKLQKIIRHMYPNLNTQRTLFGKLNIHRSSRSIGFPEEKERRIDQASMSISSEVS